MIADLAAKAVYLVLYTLTGFFITVLLASAAR